MLRRKQNGYFNQKQVSTFNNVSAFVLVFILFFPDFNLEKTFFMASSAHDLIVIGLVYCSELNGFVSMAIGHTHTTTHIQNAF